MNKDELILAQEDSQKRFDELSALITTKDQEIREAEDEQKRLQGDYRTREALLTSLSPTDPLIIDVEPTLKKEDKNAKRK